jgi:chromosome segregation ATPase
MPKSHKQRTGVKKERKPSARKRKIDEDIYIPIVPLLEPVSEVASTVTAYETKVGKIEVEDLTDVSEERASIISIVQDLEGQIDTAYELKEVLETELDITKKKLSEELAVRAELEVQVKSLGTQSVLVNQLREDISFAEEERNRLANLLNETQQQLQSVTDERDLLTEKVVYSDAQTKELDGEKAALEAQVMNLRDKVTDMNRLRGKVEDLQGKLMGADSRVAELRIQLEEQQAVNRDLMEAKTRLECEIKMANANHEATKNELETVKKVLYDVRSEATLASGRVRQRYSKTKKK